MQYLIKYADVNEQGGKSGRAALHQAAAKGHQKVMECLIEYGADKTIQDNNNKTAEQLYTASTVTIEK